MAVERERRKWTQAEYYMMVKCDIISECERVELLDGEIYHVTPQGPHHAFLVNSVAGILGEIVAPHFFVRTQSPLPTSGHSVPEPDIAVIPGAPCDYIESHPTTAALVVEISDSTVNTDRLKAALYAEGGIQEYWLVNLPLRCLEVHQAPEPWGGTWRYGSVQVMQQNATVSPIAFPGARISVRSLLP